MVQDLLVWIENRTFSEWVGVVGVLVAIFFGLIAKNTLSKKKTVKAKKGSVAFGDGASGNTVTLNAKQQVANDDKKPEN